MNRMIRFISVVGILVLGACPVFGTVVPVGMGANSAGVYIEWADGYIAEFTVSFDESTITGLGAFDAIEAETTLTTVRADFGFGIFVDGISYNGHSDIGYDGGENWWHYWIKDGAGDWTSPGFGVADRVLSDGSMDGWIYGRAGQIPEPATFALLGMGALFASRVRNRKNMIS